MVLNRAPRDIARWLGLTGKLIETRPRSDAQQAAIALLQADVADLTAPAGGEVTRALARDRATVNRLIALWAAETSGPGIWDDQVSLLRAILDSGALGEKSRVSVTFAEYVLD